MRLIPRIALAASLLGNPQGLGKVYVQVVVDVFWSLAFAKVYTSKMLDHGVRPPLRAAAAVLPSARRRDRGDPGRQRPGVLWQTLILGL